MVKLNWSQLMNKLSTLWDKGMNSFPGRIFLRISSGSGSLFSVSFSDQLCCRSHKLSQLEESDTNGVMGMESMLVVVEVSLARISQTHLIFLFLNQLPSG